MANIYTPRQQRVLLIVSILVLAGFIVAGLRQYATAFLGAGILYVVFRPWFTKLVHEKKWNRLLVTILLMLFSLIVIIMPFVVLTLLLAGRVRDVVKNYDQLLKPLRKLEQSLGVSISEQIDIQSVVGQGASLVSSQLNSVLNGTLDFVVIIGLLYFALYFMFMEEEKFLAGLRRYLPFRDKTLDDLGEELRNIVNANVVGQAAISIVQGILTGLTLWIFGVSDAAFWAVVAFFLSFIPVLGTPLVWGPAGIIALSQGDTGKGVGILLVGVIVLINVDNLLRIWLGKRMGDVHPLIVLTGIVLGVPIFGITGLVFGPLVLAYFVLLIRVFARQNQRIQAEKSPAEKADSPPTP